MVRTGWPVIAPLILGLVAASAPAARAGDPIVIYVDPDPPVIVIEHGQAPTGRVGDVIAQAVREAGIPARFDHLSWNRAMAATLAAPNTCLVPAARTPERETRFAWAGPLYRLNYGLFALKSRALRPADLAAVAAAGLRVGTVINEVSDSVLRPHKDLAVEPVSASVLNARKLAAGRIDLWASSYGSARDIAASEGLPPIEPVLDLPDLDIDFACHPATDPAVLAALDQALARTRSIFQAPRPVF